MVYDQSRRCHSLNMMMFQLIFKNYFDKNQTGEER